MMNQFNVKAMIILMVSLFLMGCAKTVTIKEKAGTEVTFSITFNGPPSFNNFNYTIIYGSASFNLNTSLSSNYFFIPGESINETTIDTISSGKGLGHFYSTYFHTWGGVMNLKPTDITLTKGPFSSSTNTDAEHFAYTSNNLSINNYKVSGNTISFTIPITDLGISGNILYFSIATSKGNAPNNTQDLVTDIQSIEIISNRPPLKGQNDTSLFTPENSAKIVSWTVTVL